MQRFRVLAPSGVILIAAHRRTAPPLLAAEQPVLHVNHGTACHRDVTDQRTERELPCTERLTISVRSARHENKDGRRRRTRIEGCSSGQTVSTARRFHLFCSVGSGSAINAPTAVLFSLAAVCFDSAKTLWGRVYIWNARTSPTASKRRC